MLGVFECLRNLLINARHNVILLFISLSMVIVVVAFLPWSLKGLVEDLGLVVETAL